MSDMSALFPTTIRPYYSTRKREDGSTVTNAGDVIAPPAWVQLALGRLEQRLPPPSFYGYRVGRA